MTVLCYTDGSALSNKKDAPAGWACYFPKLEKLFSKGIYGTNNQAELTAISFALYYSLKKLNLRNTELIIKTDSEYCIKVLGHPKNIKVNKEKIENCKKMINLLNKQKTTVRFIHVSAHTNGKDFDSVCNDIVDKKAREKALQMKAL